MRPPLALALALLLLPVIAHATFPVLPATFTTKRGQVIADGHIITITDKGIKIIHSAGIALLPASDFPAEVLATLGIAPVPAAADSAATPGKAVRPALPDPLRADGMEYTQPALVAIDPDGIRILHREGSAHIPYEKLEPALQQLLGGFDAAKAAAFRATQATAQAATQAKIRQTALASMKADNKTVAAAAALADADYDKVRAEPGYLTRNAAVNLQGRAQGGKSRYEPWKTDYGSYERVDASSYQLICTLQSTARGPQRVRMQAFRLSRNLDTRAFEVKLVGDCNVTYGTNVPVTVSAVCEAVNTDNNYVTLGQREQAGDKYVGWTWRALDGQDRIIAVVSSQSAFDHYAREQPVRSQDK